MSNSRAETGPFALELLGIERTPNDDGTDRLSAALRLENLTGDVVFNMVPVDYLRLRENGAYLISPDVTSTGSSLFYADTELSPGETVDGDAVFPVPRDSAFIEIILLTEAGPLVLPVAGDAADVPVTRAWSRPRSAPRSAAVLP